MELVISDKEREFYNKMQNGFKDLIKYNPSLTQEIMLDYIQKLSDEMKTQEVDIQKIMYLCSKDPESVLKIQPVDNKIETGPVGQNYDIKDDDTPEAVCVYKRL